LLAYAKTLARKFVSARIITISYCQVQNGRISIEIGSDVSQLQRGILKKKENKDFLKIILLWM
jgi:hypothetical protein